MNNVCKVGITDARTNPTRLYWDRFFSILDIVPQISSIDAISAIEKSKIYLESSNCYCLFRHIDLGQHIDLIEKKCNCLIIPSTRSENMLTCGSSRFMSEHLSMNFPEIDVLNFRIHMDDKGKQREEITSLAKYFTDDNNKIELLIKEWPDFFPEQNCFYLKDSKKEINILIIGRIYYFFDYRNINSPYINILHKKLNCNILTFIDIADLSIVAYKSAYKKLKEYYPYWQKNIERYWNQNYITRALTTGKQKIDGVLFVKDPWCESAKEESPLIIKILKEMEIPYYLLDFSLESLSSIDTILESFIEMLLYRKRKNVCIRD